MLGYCLIRQLQLTNLHPKNPIAHKTILIKSIFFNLSHILGMIFVCVLMKE